MCEAACTCGLNGQPVTVKDNELGIIEEAWEQGLMSPRPPETRTGRTVAVVGSGPAGLSPALKGLTAEVTASPCSSGPTDPAAC